jgi:tRNA pseudouridine(55) synthase
MFGLLALDKRTGVRSSFCVEKIKSILGKKIKTGHGGTLDSTASGLLVILAGAATRLSGAVMSMPKTYRAVIKLGAETSTCDYSGEVTRSGDFSRVGETEIGRALTGFYGWRMQTPPEVSAVRVKGRRAHEIFRAGGEPDICPRPVFIEKIRVIRYDSQTGELELLVDCGKGTYVRALARDVGRALGCFGHLSSLRRERIGFFSVADALPFGNDFSIARDELIARMLPPKALGAFLPCYSADADVAKRLANGVFVSFSRLRRVSFGLRAPEGEIMALSGKALSIGSLHGVKNAFYAPEINIDVAEQPEPAE